MLDLDDHMSAKLFNHAGYGPLVMLALAMPPLFGTSASLARQTIREYDWPQGNSDEPITLSQDVPASVPRSNERAAERRRMVTEQIEARGVDDPAVLDAMAHVPRHWFVPAEQSARAYHDRPLPIGYGQTISQPYIVALMTQVLDVERMKKVLEIGTGSGYQAAVLAELTDQVYTIEIVEPLAKRTIKLLKEKGYKAIHTRIGDGYQGWPEAAPFDAIIVTCAPEAPPKPLVDQLAVGGKMCIPVGKQGGIQELVVITKKPDGSLQRRHIEWVQFVPMTGQSNDANRNATKTR